MSIDLYQMSKYTWVVKNIEGELHGFSSTEEAALFLESIGVMDEEIDYALSAMITNDHCHAQFGILEGRFIFSDNEKPDGIIGIA